VAGVVGLLLIAGACSSDKDDEEAVTTSTTATTVAGTSTTSGLPCSFTPVDGGGETTWVQAGQLRSMVLGASPHCLADEVSARRLEWSGDSNEVLADNRVLSAQGVRQEFAKDLALRLSRPTGRSVIQLGQSDGRLLKYENGAMSTKDITFVDKPTEAVYHPAGRSIVASGMENGKNVLKIADNLGHNARVIALGETASSIHDLAFTASNALLFVGEHSGESHLHRLELETGKLTTVATAKAPAKLGHVVTSPFPGGSVAWTTGTSCDLVVEQDGKFIDVQGTAVASATPIGWLPNRTVVVKTGPCNEDGPGDLYAVGATGPPILLAQGVGAASVRAVLPDPTPPPADVPDDAPA
jgi:hypothetical protein